MVWFVLGAVIGCVQMAISMVRRPTVMEHPYQGFAFVAALGAAVYGTILWLIFG